MIWELFEDMTENDALQGISKEPDLVIITGMSGAGRTEAMHTFEDMGYFCIDNLPPSLLSNLVNLSELGSQQDKAKRRLAVVCDIRAQEFFSELESELNHIRELGISSVVLFMDARDDVLLSRFKAARRPHPLCTGNVTTAEGILYERGLLVEARTLADRVFDTSSDGARDLRRKIRSLFSDRSEQQSMEVFVISFGFKHGLPIEADIVIDVRFLPNPFYDTKLKALTGLDQEVRDYVLKRDPTSEFLDSWKSLLSVVMPGYVSEGKRSLIIAIGCTGGQHRSVVLTEETGQFLKNAGYTIHINHRDISLAETQQ
jgi:UPF0042 nucleotide-binding protein